MKPPTKVKVSPFTVTISLDRTLSRVVEASGSYQADMSMAVIDPGLELGQEQDTVLHELLHAIWRQTHLDTKYPDEDADSKGELIIQTLAPRLLALIRDNPKLVAYLQS